MKKDATIILIFVLVAYTLVVVSVHFTQGYVIFRSGGASNAPPNHLDITPALQKPEGARAKAPRVKP
jgi:hypothetical protein